MKKQLDEVKRLQKIAGILKENVNEAPETGEKMSKLSDLDFRKSAGGEIALMQRTMAHNLDYNVDFEDEYQGLNVTLFGKRDNIIGFLRGEKDGQPYAIRYVKGEPIPDEESIQYYIDQIEDVDSSTIAKMGGLPKGTDGDSGISPFGDRTNE